MDGRASGAAVVPPAIAIVGLGLIGTSIALAIRRRQPDALIVGVDRAEVIGHPRIVETFTSATTELSAVANAGLVVLATPINNIIETIPKLATIAPHAVVTDTGSTKRAVLAAAQASGLSRFVGGHPMAGSDRSGAAAARADMFDAHSWFLFGDARAVTVVGEFVRTLGATPVFMTGDGGEHDTLMAAISHFPQVVVSALMARVGEAVGSEGLAYAGTGLKDTTRLAGSEAAVWEGVLATNADALRPLLRQLAADLEKLAGQLEDPAAIRRVFGMANMYRRNVTGQTS